MILPPVAADLALQACMAFLSCIASQGLNPAYVHQLQVTPPDVQVIYDGVTNDAVIDAVRACAVPQTKLRCEFHQEKLHD